jgi:hypothetical protein
VVDPIEVRADGDGPLELRVRLTGARPKYGDRFLELPPSVRNDDDGVP